MQVPLKNRLLSPAKRYFLIFSGILSSKLPQVGVRKRAVLPWPRRRSLSCLEALAKGEWLDKYQPLVDTVEPCMCQRTVCRGWIFILHLA